MNAADLDYDALRQYAVENIPNLLFVSVSGAHLYGFPSSDSDVDLRGAFAAPIEAVLSLNLLRETVQPSAIVEGVEVEAVAHEITKYLKLLIKPNGYVLEQILSPLVVLTSPAHAELQALARESLSKRLYFHYAGFAKGEWRDYQKSDANKTVKRLLYLHRVLMTGIVLLTEGIVEANLIALNSRFPLDLAPLLAMKTREQATVEGDDLGYTSGIIELFGRLDEARDRSPLPDSVPNRAAISDFLVRLRLSNIDAGS